MDFRGNDHLVACTIRGLEATFSQLLNNPIVRGGSINDTDVGSFELVLNRSTPVTGEENLTAALVSFLAHQSRGGFIRFICATHNRALALYVDARLIETVLNAKTFSLRYDKQHGYTVHPPRGEHPPRLPRDPRKKPEKAKPRRDAGEGGQSRPRGGGSPRARMPHDKPLMSAEELSEITTSLAASRIDGGSPPDSGEDSLPDSGTPSETDQANREPTYASVVKSPPPEKSGESPEPAVNPATAKPAAAKKTIVKLADANGESTSQAISPSVSPLLNNGSNSSWADEVSDEEAEEKKKTENGKKARKA